MLKMEVRKRLSKELKCWLLAGMVFSFSAILSIPIGAIFIASLLAPMPSLIQFAIALFCGIMASKASKKLRLYTPQHNPFTWD